MYIGPVEFGDLVFLFFPPLPLAITVFLVPPLLWGSLRLEVRNLMEASCLELSVLRSLTVCIMSDCRSLYLFPCDAGVRFSDDGRAKY